MLRAVGVLALSLAVLGVLGVSNAQLCPAGQYQYGSNCYLMGATSVSWITAREICSTRGGVLATINSLDELTFLQNTAKSLQTRADFWIGITDEGSEGQWRNIDNTNVFLLWNGGQPDNFRNNENCGEITQDMDYKMNDESCIATNRYICKRSINFVDPCDSDNGWHLINNKCYKFFTESKNWLNARQVCRESNADLISINNQQELNFVTESISCSNQQPIWLGLSDSGPGRTLAWNDASQMNAMMTRWDTKNGEPNVSKFPKGSNCAAVIPLDQFQWVLDNCNTDERQYICEKDQGQCPSGWTESKGTCYQIQYAVTTWPRAVAKCQENGGKLSSPDATKWSDQTVVPGSLLSSARAFNLWFGISDIQLDQTYADLDGNVISTSSPPAWDAGMPAAGSFPKRPDCAVVSPMTLKLRMVSCFAKNIFICEVDKGAVKPVTPAPLDSLGCAAGWLKNKDRCYWLEYKAKSYQAAKADCINKGASLMIINDIEEQSFISMQPSISVWIGMDDLQTQGTFKWVDGTTPTFLNWAKGNPDNQGGREDCVEVLRWGEFVGEWNDNACDDLRAYACERAALPGGLPSPAPTRPWSTQCGIGWTIDSLAGNCYWFSTDQLDWVSARQFCQKNGAELLSIESKFEQTFLQGIFNGDPTLALSYWMGANDLDIEQGWMWSDGKPYRYINWAPTEPNNLNEEDCGEIVKLSGRWNDNRCSMKQTYICKKPAPVSGLSLMTTAAPVPQLSSDCATVDLISGDHWIPDTAITASSTLKKDSGTENSRIDWTATDSLIKISTKDEYVYRPATNLNLMGVTSLTFTVQACNDAHISLQPDVNNITNQAYEIVLGGWSNSRSVIRKTSMGAEFSKEYQASVLDCKQVKQFWISWANSKVEVGTGNQVSGSTTILSVSDSNPYQVSGIAVSTGWGAIGDWVITNPHGTRQGAWSPKYSVIANLPLGTEQTIFTEWIQADFSKPMLIQNVTTKGRADANEYVTSYVISYAYSSDQDWNYVMKIGETTTQVFAGNTDRNTAVTNTFEVPFEARLVRLTPRKFVNFPSLRWSLSGCPSPKYCTPEPLVTGAISVPDQRITASSLKESTTYDVRLNAMAGKAAPKGWVATTPDVQTHSVPNEWLQIDLGTRMLVTGIVTKGRVDQPHWVKTYQLQFRDDGTQFVNYQEPYGQVRTFDGNTDQNTAVTNELSNPVAARYVRIIPKTFEKIIAMRADVLGCLTGCSSSPLINGERPIAASRLSASSQESSLASADRARLNVARSGSLVGAWVVQQNNLNQYLQVDFGVAEIIRAVATQGRQDVAQWVMTYTLAYSQDGKTFYTYTTTNPLPGNFDQNTIVKNVLLNPVTAQALRIYPKSWKDKIAMRFEVYGCQGSVPKSMGCYRDSSVTSPFSSSLYVPYNSPARCSEYCFKKGFLFAGLKRTTCLCSSEYPDGGVTNRCDYRCPGDSRLYCGGYDATAMSVYDTGLGPDDELCADGYEEFQGTCYKVVITPQTWQDAQKACRMDGGDLATINGAPQFSYLKSVTSKVTANNVWIGLNDLKDQFSFDWSDGEAVLATFWQRGEPRSTPGQNENCVLAYSGAVKGVAANGLWDNVACNQPAAYLCQKSKSRTGALRTTPAPVVGCPAGWMGYQSSCYTFLDYYSVWDLAKTTCANDGGYLVRVDNEYEQNFLTTEIYKRNTGRAGDSLSTQRTYWTDLKANLLSKTWLWSNNWDVIPYTHWDKGQPPAFPQGNPLNGFIFGGPSYCVSMNGGSDANTGYWQRRDCQYGAFIICERPRTGYTQPPRYTQASDQILCPTGWNGIGPSCYQINAPTDPLDRKTWEAAEKHCVRQGAHLAYINNGTAMDFLWRNFLLTTTKTVEATQGFWIGLNERERSKGYAWVSGDPVSYTNWEQGEPNDWGGLEPCTFVKPDTGKWNDEVCGQPNNWICSVKRTDVKKIMPLATTVAPTAGPPGSCPDGDDWKFWNGKCYYMNAQSMTWSSAIAFCTLKGASLASIASSMENNFVRSLSKGLITNLWDRQNSASGGYGSRIWIGLNELDRQRGHRWSDGTGYAYTQWAENEPNDFNGGEYCVSMYALSGDWNDEHCSRQWPFVCEKSKTQTGPLTTSQPPTIQGFCPTGYVDFENDCYKITVDKKTNWTTAEKTCEAEGGHLTHILNDREQVFLTSLLPIAKRAQTNLWIGLTHDRSVDQSIRTVFSWAANYDISFTNWNTGEPNGKQQSPCTEMMYNPAGRWGDIDCSAERGSICRKPKDGRVLTTPAPDNSKCPSGYTLWENSCYRYVSTKNVWDQYDSKICSDDGADLLSIQDPYERSFVQQWLWRLGAAEDTWIGLTSNSNKYSWSNSWPVAVTYWFDGEPSGFKNQRSCVVMNVGQGDAAGMWKHAGCTEMHPGICKKPLSSPPIIPPFDGDCKSAGGENWIANTDDHCYLFVVDPRYTFDGASAACIAAGGDLASIHDDEDISFHKTYLEHIDVVGGIGTKNVWIGLVKDATGGYSWVDGTGVYFANWADNEPSDKLNKEKCVEMYAETAEWNDIDCDSRRGFICQIYKDYKPSAMPLLDTGTPPSMTLSTAEPSPCQLEGWVFYNGSCYLLVADSDALLHWGEAESWCRAPGKEANLVSISSPAENQWIVDNLLPKVTSGTDTWIGFAELSRDDYFGWTDNSKITYTNWDAKQPDLNWGSMECTAMQVNGLTAGAAGRWSTEYCFSKKAFICEINPTKEVRKTISVSVTNGGLCRFPFKYRGQDYNTCTTYGTQYLWCATTDNYDRDGKWALCDPFDCPPGWKRLERLCYFFSAPNDKKSWLDAEAQCSTYGSDLGYIGSPTVQSFITGSIDEYFWMGLNDRDTEGAYQWDHKPNIVFIRGFTNWGINEPRNLFEADDCVQIVNGPYSDGRPGEWIVENCQVARRYVCMKEASYTLEPTTRVATSAVMTTAPSALPSKAPTVGSYSSTLDGKVGASPLKGTDSPVGDADMAKLRTGEIIAIVIATGALLLAGVFIFLYLRKTRPEIFAGQSKDVFDNAAYSRSDDTVHVRGLSNPNFVDQ